jgi:hypothetical protein
VAEGKPVDGFPGVWEGFVPLPPEKRGEAIVGVVFTNAVGLSTTATQRIELVDAPPPLGHIDGIVKTAELPGAGANVSLLDGEGKLKGAAIADAKGKFKFDNLPPGVYKVSSKKSTSSYPLAATEDVQVEANKRSKTTLSMKKVVK